MPTSTPMSLSPARSMRSMPRATGPAMPSASIDKVAVRVKAKSGVTIDGATTVTKPQLWGPPPTQHPHRYVAITTITRNGRVVDRYETPFGIRSLHFDPDGVIVN